MARVDHDQRFKNLIREFFTEFLELFFSLWAVRLDTSAVEWLEQEMFPDPPDGPRRIFDLVAKVPTRHAVRTGKPGEPDHYVALVHIEIESPDRATPLRSRFCDDYLMLRAKHRLPVLPIGLFLNVGLDGVGTDIYTESIWELTPLKFEYLYVGLPGLDGLQYLQGDNWLGVALSSLMKTPKDKVAWLGAEALRRLMEAPLGEKQRFLLAECVQAYLPMDEEQKREYEALMIGESFAKVQAMNKTVFEQGVEKGMEKGVATGAVLGQQELVRDQLQDRFGPLPSTVIDRFMKLPAERVREVGRALLRAASLKELGLADE